MKFRDNDFDKSIYWYADPARQFQIKNIFLNDKKLESFDTGGARKKIAVIGGGVAGLSAAYELHKLDHQVVLYEQSDRIGGRIRSHLFSDGLCGDLGPMRIPQTHHATLGYCEKFGLELDNFVNRNDNAFRFLRGHLSRLGDTSPQSMDIFDLHPEERYHPFELLAKVMLSEIAILENNERYELFDNILHSKRVKELDDYSLHQRLLKHLSRGAVDYVLSSTALLQYQHMSFKAVLMDWWGLFDIRHYRVVGGTQRLTDAFAAFLGDIIRLNTRIVSIRLCDDGVDVVGCQNGADHFEKRFDQIIVAAPARATAAIEFSPALQHAKQESLSNLTQVSSSKTLMLCKKRFWELNDGIYGGGSFTDRCSQSIWYPSDNADPVTKNTKGAVRWKPRCVDRSHAPAILTAAYAWGNNARYLKSLGDDGATSETIATLKKIHGDSVEAEIEAVVHWHWDEHCRLGGGSFGFFQPGEHQKYQKALAMAYPDEKKPKVFFAGEHVAVAHSWIETAIQSSLSSVARVLAS